MDAIGGSAIVAAGVALALAVSVGLVAHELSHAVVLRLAGVRYAVEFFPGRADGLVPALALRPWALVRPVPSGRESPRSLRVAALAPFLLALPVAVPAAVGFAPSLDRPIVSAVAIGWLACAIPSPQDFSVAFYAHRAVETAADVERDEPEPEREPAARSSRA